MRKMKNSDGGATQQFHVIIPVSTVKQIRVCAILEDTDTSAIVERAIQQYLDAREKRQSKP